MGERFSIEKHYTSRTSGKVYIAVDEEKEEVVRLQRLFSDLPPERQQGGADYLKVLKRQYSEMKGPSLVGISDYAIDEEGLWISVPHVESVDLLSYLKGPMPLEEFETMASQLLEVLAKAHKINVFHGSISPNSIDVVAKDGELTFRFTEFGYRKLFHMIQNSAITQTLPAEPSITAPELFDLFEEPDAASDVYMLGQVFYTVLGGGHPWVGLDHDAALKAHLAHDIRPLHEVNPSISEDLSDWVDSLIQADPLKRPKNAGLALDKMPSATAEALNMIRDEVVDQEEVKTFSDHFAPKIEAPKKKKKISPAMLCTFAGVFVTLAAVAIVFIAKMAAENVSELESGKAGTEPNEIIVPTPDISNDPKTDPGNSDGDANKEALVKTRTNQQNEKENTGPVASDPENGVETKNPPKDPDKTPVVKDLVVRTSKKQIPPTSASRLVYRFDKPNHEKMKSMMKLYGDAKLSSSYLDFDGNGDYALLNLNLEQWSAITVEGVFSLRSAKAWMRIFDFGNNQQEYFAFSVQASSGNPIAMVSMSGKSGDRVDVPAVLKVGEEQHFSVSLDGQFIEFFLNGQRVGKLASSIRPKDFLSATSNYYLGKSIHGHDPTLDGRIHELSIFPRALSGAEVKKLAQEKGLESQKKSPAQIADGTQMVTPVKIVRHGQAIPNSLQPLKPYGVTIGYTNVAAFKVGETVGFRQQKGWNEGEFMAFAFTKDIQIQEMEVGNEGRAAGVVTVEAYGDQAGKKLLKRLSVNVPQRPAAGEDAFVKVSGLAPLGVNIRLLKVAFEGRGNAHVRGFTAVTEGEKEAGVAHLQGQKTHKFGFQGQKLFVNLKEISSEFQPLKPRNIVTTFKNTGSYFENENWTLFQMKGKDRIPISISFSHPIKIDSFDVANHFPEKCTIEIAAFSGENGTELAGKYMIPIQARENGVRGEKLVFTTVDDLAELGSIVTRVIVRATSDEGIANAHLDNLVVTTPDGIRLEDKNVREEDGVYLGEMTLTQSCVEAGRNNIDEFIKPEDFKSGQNLHTKNKKAREAWFQLDLLEQKQIKRIRLRKVATSIGRGNDLELLVSTDGNAWELVTKSNDALKQVQEEWFDVNRKARYVKFRTARNGHIELEHILFELDKFLPL